MQPVLAPSVTEGAAAGRGKGTKLGLGSCLPALGCSLRWPPLGRRSFARQCLVSRGLLPFLATPSQGDGLLDDAIKHAARLGLVKPMDHVVSPSVYATATWPCTYHEVMAEVWVTWL